MKHQTSLPLSGGWQRGDQMDRMESGLVKEMERGYEKKMTWENQRRRPGGKRKRHCSHLFPLSASTEDESQ